MWGDVRLDIIVDDVPEIRIKCLIFCRGHLTCSFVCWVGILGWTLQSGLLPLAFGQLRTIVPQVFVAIWWGNNCIARAAPNNRLRVPSKPLARGSWKVLLDGAGCLGNTHIKYMFCNCNISHSELDMWP